ncbi:Zinc finger protein klf1 [Cyberlindnera fabianii]|uniref:Zinc finger protein klf1 n=1 Tax=Cyberlindnera fabianii TaxID=36022 RepID=A0A1V2L6P1_CYBFA|nr:Zinc finger protein klf1 [Cyberlindnera fabianii]
MAVEDSHQPPMRAVSNITATPMEQVFSTTTTTSATTSSSGSSRSSSDAEDNDGQEYELRDGNGEEQSTSGAVKKHKSAKKRRKRRPAGVFNCDFEGCDKRFTRQEHLARHKLNHNPTVIYNCTWNGCDKSFVRSDLRERHVKRHEMRKLKEEAKARNAALNPNKRRRVRSRQVQPPPEVSTQDPNAAQPLQDKSTAQNDSSVIKEDPSEVKKLPINSLDSIILPNIEDSAPINIHNYDNEDHLSAARGEVAALHPSDISDLIGHSKGNSLLVGQAPFLTTPPTPPSINVPLSNSGEPPQSAASPARLVNWLFDDQVGNDIGTMDSVPHFTNGNFFNPDDDPFGLSSDLLNDILVIPPNFPHPAHQTTITPEVQQSLIRVVPAIATHDHLQHLDLFLEAYWTCFHTQYPILHKPSFSTQTCPPILLLSIIMLGAAYYTSNPDSIFERTPREFGDIIAEPLRGIIFASRDFQPPSHVWVIQSLLMLEHYERLSTNRILHERAYVHHGTTIQLLRRSPGLGGNPLNNKTDYDSAQSATIWEKWIQFETLKRSALFAFYMDSTHGIVFGYQLMLFTHQIQLSLPCDEELWDSYLTPKEIPNKSEQLPFLSALKKLLNREPVQTSRFGKKILLSGLLTIMFQMQQRDLQGSLLEFDELRDTWKDSLSLAFDYWNCDIMNGCCNTPNAIYWKDVDRKHDLPLALREDDTRCKFPVYHMAQITLRIQHYDYYIYAGAPWRMNVEAEASDYELVDKKIKEWASSLSGKISVVYGYMFLFEMFLSPQDSTRQWEYKFHSNEEAIWERLNVLALVILLVWSYNFSNDGPESRVLLHDPRETRLVPKESGLAYLRRVRDEFTRFAGEFVHTSHPGDSVKYHNMIRLMATKLPHIRNKHHMAGLLNMMSEIFKDNYWEVGDEFSRLIRNCYRRSFGSPKVRCDDMYKHHYV